MAKTLLNGLNEVLQKVGALDSEAGLLASLTDSARQVPIDVAIQSINEMLDELYTLPGAPAKPNQLFERTLTLVTNDRDYKLNSNLIKLRHEYDLIDETNNHTIFLLDAEDGYHQIIRQDPELDDTGQPAFAALRPTDGELFMDKIPTANENGLVYKYRFDGDLVLSAADDEFPFKDVTFRAIVEAAAEKWKFHRHLEGDERILNNALGRAARTLTQRGQRSSWMPLPAASNPTDPMERD